MSLTSSLPSVYNAGKFQVRQRPIFALVLNTLVEDDLKIEIYLKRVMKLARKIAFIG